MIKVDIDANKWLREMGLSVAKTLEVSKAVFTEAVTNVYNTTIEFTVVGDPSLWKYPAPKDYKPGTLKASWTLTIEGNEATISNNQPYAERVEYGWSTQAPQGMLRKALSQYSYMLQTAAISNKL